MALFHVNRFIYPLSGQGVSMVILRVIRNNERLLWSIEMTI